MKNASSEGHWKDTIILQMTSQEGTVRFIPTNRKIFKPRLDLGFLIYQSNALPAELPGRYPGWYNSLLFVRNGCELLR